MQPLTAKSLKGSWGTLLLPINKDDSIDFQRLEDEIAYLLHSRISGIYTNGTAGEFYNQTEDEFDKITELLALKCAKADMTFQLGVSHMNPMICLERIKRCKHLKPSAFQIILPDWVPPNEKEQLAFLKKVAEVAAPVPLVLYNPPHAKVVLRPFDFKKIAEHIPQLIGIKVADGDAQWYANMRVYASQLSVFVPGHHLATGMKAKVGVGAYSNIACLHPLGAQQWYELMLEDVEEALKIEKKIFAFFARCLMPFIQAGYADPALDKFLAAVGGWAPIGTRLRWPYQWIDEKEVAPIRKLARQMLPEIMLNNRG